MRMFIRCKLEKRENRLKGVYDSEQRLSSYLYDAGGERTLKMSGSYQSTYINSSLTISSVNMTDYTLYTSPYMVMTDNEYTKHYYVEADRVASKIGGGMANNITDINDVVIGFEMQSEENYLQKTNDVLDMMTNDFNELEVNASIEVYTNTVFWEGKALGQNNSEQKIYFFHKDHLGSSTQISDISANIIHHVEYMPYGETFVEQRSNWGTNYKFNGKELDEETGYYYYGARYYTPDLSIWLSVDPLSDERSWLSPYNYCQWNPIRRVDPDGALDEENADWVKNKNTNEYVWMDNVTAPRNTPNGYSYVGSEDNDILNDLNIETNLSSQSQTKSGISVQDGDNVGPSGKGSFGIANPNQGNGSLNVKPIIAFDLKNSTENNKLGKKFVGVMISGSLSIPKGNDKSQNGGGLSVVNGGNQKWAQLLNPKVASFKEAGSQVLTASIFIPSHQLSKGSLKNASLSFGMPDKSVMFRQPIKIDWDLQKQGVFINLKQ